MTKQTTLLCLVAACFAHFVTETCATAPTPTTMLAIVATGAAEHEGDFSKIKIVDNFPVPKPGPGQVLINVIGSSVNPVDWKILSTPAFNVSTFPRVLGFDLSGFVESVGPGCTRLKVDDRVWADLGKPSANGLQLGAWAQYAVADCDQVGLVPNREWWYNQWLKDVSTLPLVALTDYQAFKKAGAPWTDRKNFTVVITSGSGGTGLVAIQLAKAWGATRIVTASSPQNMKLLKKLGATDVFDYHKTSIWKELGEDSVDIVYDNFGAPGTADAAMASIRSGGVFVFLPGKGGAISKHPKQGVKQIDYGLCDPSNHEDLDALMKIFVDIKVQVVVEDWWSINDSGLKGALERSMSGKAVGKIGLDIAFAARTSTLVV